MKNKTPLLIIGVVVVLGIIGAVVYAMTMNKDEDHSSMKMSSDSSNNSSQGSSTDTSAKDAVATDTVKIENFAYSPATITVKKGTKVTWTNNDTVEHNVVGDDFKDLDGKLLKKGESFSFTFDKVGTYAYHCDPHPYMKGTVIVTE